MSTITPPEHASAVCPVCWETISHAQWEQGCCLTPEEREVIR